MTYILPPEHQPIRVQVDANDQPTVIFWRENEHRIERISNSYRIPDGSLESPIWREYFQVITRSGWLMLIYHDLIEGIWGLEMLFD